MDELEYNKKIYDAYVFKNAVKSDSSLKDQLSQNVNQILDSYFSQINDSERVRLFNRLLESYKDHPELWKLFFEQYDKEINCFLYNKNNFNFNIVCLIINTFWMYFDEWFEYKLAHIDLMIALTHCKDLKLSIWWDKLFENNFLNAFDIKETFANQTQNFRYYPEKFLIGLIVYHYNEYNIWCKPAHINEVGQSYFVNPKKLLDSVSIQKNSECISEIFNNFNKWFDKHYFKYSSYSSLQLVLNYNQKFLEWWNPYKFVYTDISCLELCKNLLQYFNIWYNPKLFVYKTSYQYLKTHNPEIICKIQDDYIHKIIAGD